MGGPSKTFVVLHTFLARKGFTDRTCEEEIEEEKETQIG